MVPRARLYAAVLAWIALALPAHWLPALDLPTQVLAAVLALVALGDALLARRAPPLTVVRELPGVLPVGAWRTVALRVHNAGARARGVQLFDDGPPGWEVEGLPLALEVAAGGFAQAGYRLRPDARGDAQLGACWLRVRSALGLWDAPHRVGPAQEVRVFPDYSAILRQTLHGTDRRAPTAGALVQRQRGEGTDFRQLREYRIGDSLRSIDWKATARHRKPISREYQQERDQQVVFLLDSGRRMLAQDGVTSHFDHALHAVLTLSFVAAKQGDAVGLMSFGGPTRWLAPAKGAAGLDRVLAGVYDLQPTETAPDYLRAAQDLMGRLSRRAFVILITNLRDEDDRALRAACELLSRRHLVLCASLRERALDAVAQAPVTRFDDALRLGATELYLQQRRTAIRQLGLPRERLVDVTPERLAGALLTRYYEVKESGAL